jgi:AcrR family transcriptional regulator
MARRRSARLPLEPGVAPSAKATAPRRQNLPEVILEAAETCFERWGIRRTRVEDIANEAQMPRPHVYRHFASKDAIVHAVVLRAIERHHTRLAERLPIAGPSAPLILDTLRSGVQDAPNDVRALTRSDSAEITAQSLASSPEIVEALRSRWQPVLEHAAARGELRPGVEIDAAARWLVFVQFSVLAFERPDVQDELRAFVLPSLLTDEALTALRA